MPLQIVRNDITKMHADAIVNSTNRYLACGGVGVDASIHAAAGKELDAALAKIGYCPVGSAVITESFNIPWCRFIIHAVSPVYCGGTYSEERELRNCYRKIFSLALENGCRTLAIPILCAGANGYPKEEAYTIASASAREFLNSLDEDMMIWLVVFDEDMTDIGKSHTDEITEYITGDYPDFNRKTIYDRRTAERRKPRSLEYDRKKNPFDRVFGITAASRPDMEEKPEESAPTSDFNAAEELFIECSMAPCAAEPFSESPAVQTDYRKEDRSFGDMCDWWMNRKQIDIHEFYGRSNLSRGAYYNLRNKPEQIPKKTTAFACIMALRLNEDEASDLLLRAGLAFSPYFALDRIVREHIRSGDYDIDRLNIELFAKDLATLGSTAM